MLSTVAFLSGCSKNYDTEIDNLQKQITDNKTAIDALKTAMAKGTMITKVEKTDNGYKLTMSDNTVLTLQNGENGTNGKDAPVPQLRVNAAKNWEMSTDGGATWAEVKDADGNPIADAKSFVLNYVKIDANGYLVIGDKTTSFQYDVTIPEVLILPDQLVALIAVPNSSSPTGFDLATVPMLGYFDKWSVASIQPIGSKTTFAVTKVTLSADAAIDGVEYKTGDVVYSSAGVPVVLNPSKIDASVIPFAFVASLEGGEVYELPVTLAATIGTDQKISTITKAVDPTTAVWTIRLAGAANYSLKGPAQKVALCAKNQNGTHTQSDYVFDITEANGSSPAVTTAVVDAEGYQGEDAVVAPATNIMASTLYAADPADAAKIMVVTEDGRIVEGETGSYTFYTGAYHVVLVPSRTRDLDPDLDAPVSIDLIYECIGLDGTAATPVNVTVTFIDNTPISAQYVVADAFVPSGDDTDDELEITKAEFLAQVFGSNSIAQARFEAKGINFDIVPDAKAAASGVEVAYYLDGVEVPNPATAAAWNKVKITVPQTALFAHQYVPVADAYTFGLTFQMGGNTPPTYTLKANLRFALDGTSPAVTAAWGGSDPVVIAAAAGQTQIALTDIDLSDVNTTPITTTGAVAEFTGLVENADVTLFIDGVNMDEYYLRRKGVAPATDKNVTVTLLGIDAWGKEFSVDVNVTVSSN